MSLVKVSAQSLGHPAQVEQRVPRAHDLKTARARRASKPSFVKRCPSHARSIPRRMDCRFSRILQTTPVVKVSAQSLGHPAQVEQRVPRAHDLKICASREMLDTSREVGVVGNHIHVHHSGCSGDAQGGKLRVEVQQERDPQTPPPQNEWTTTIEGPVFCSTTDPSTLPGTIKRNHERLRSQLFRNCPPPLKTIPRAAGRTPTTLDKISQKVRPPQPSLESTGRTTP